MILLLERVVPLPNTDFFDCNGYNVDTASPGKREQTSHLAQQETVGITTTGMRRPVPSAVPVTTVFILAMVT
jgi:hypothetical protein